MIIVVGVVVRPYSVGFSKTKIMIGTIKQRTASAAARNKEQRQASNKQENNKEIKGQERAYHPGIIDSSL